MKGIVFTSFNEMVEDKFGLDVWDALLTKVNPKSEGIYTSGGTYEDAELLGYVKELSEITKIGQPELIEAFGLYLFPVLSSKYPEFLAQPNLYEFLKSVDKIIHVEVNKLYPEAILPTMTYEEPSSDSLIINYSSPRKLCALAKGLIRGASEYYKTPITVNETICLLHGNDHCRIEVGFGK